MYLESTNPIVKEAFEMCTKPDEIQIMLCPDGSKFGFYFEKMDHGGLYSTLAPRSVARIYPSEKDILAFVGRAYEKGYYGEKVTKAILASGDVRGKRVIVPNMYGSGSLQKARELQVNLCREQARMVSDPSYKKKLDAIGIEQVIDDWSVWLEAARKDESLWFEPRRVYNNRPWWDSETLGEYVARTFGIAEFLRGRGAQDVLFKKDIPDGLCDSIIRSVRKS